ncbi:MAG: 23S rRNA (adenine(2503)-C2)-methyltransferase, partial [Candidatus Melainabacteria bacterium HGW-Melainabacteria-1]
MHSLLDLDSLKNHWKARRWGQPAWQVFERGYFEALHDSYADFEDLPAAVLTDLSTEVPFFPLKLAHESIASDGTVKVLFETLDGLKFETVLMRYNTGGRDRYTVCVSSQVGCPARCTFCATATMSFSRNLRSDEIIAQVLWFNRRLKARHAKVQNVVLMGMGEPLLNYEQVKSALDTLLTQRLFGMGPRHITLSSVGILPGLDQLIADKLPVNLAISLHAPTDELRSQIIPVNRAYPLAELFARLDRWTANTGKQVFYQYVMLRDRNDGDTQADQLGELLHKRPARLNLIPYNPGPGLEDLDPSELSRIHAFAARLRSHGLHVL